jgi:two-component system response regulator YesN
MCAYNKEMEYTLILVDDEAQVRSSIRRNTPWNDYGFSVIGEANNGVEAIELVEDLKPDVIITDIRMPYLDGIELIKQIREIQPTITIIILSGYDEFTYAQTAIHYNVKEYILKPVSKNDFCELLERTKKMLDENYLKINNINVLEDKYKQALPLLKEKFLLSLLTPTRDNNNEELIQRAKSFDYNIKGNHFIVATVEANRNDSPLVAMAMMEVCKERLDDKNAIFLQVEDQIVIIFIENKMGDNDSFTSLYIKQVFRMISDLSSYLNKYLKGGCTIGIGSVVHYPAQIHVSYKESLIALNYKAYQENQEILYINDVEHIEHPTVKKEMILSKRDEFLTALKMGDKDEVEKLASTLFDNTSGLNPEGLQSYLLSIVSLLADVAISYGTSISQANNSKGDRNFIQELSSITTVNKAKKWFTDLSININQALKGKREQSHIKFVEDAKKYIEEHYQDQNLCLEKLCDYLGISTAYFSSTFKKETGTSFVTACNITRITKAKKLMLETDMKNYEISEMVGFSDSNYFSFCFKRTVGLSPSKYRNQLVNHE